MVSQNLIEGAVSILGSIIKIDQSKNPHFQIDREYVAENLPQVEACLKTKFGLDDIELILKKIKSLYSIYQEEGSAIINFDPEHDYQWFDKLKSSKDFNSYFWDRYKNYLLQYKHFSPNVVDTLENKTLEKLMSYLGNPNTPKNVGFSKRGLVVGDVQSGKTSNYLGLMTRAADAGYRVFILLTGTIESLRKQTQERVEEGFIGYDSDSGRDVGVMRGDPMPFIYTSRVKDFTGDDNKNTTYRINNDTKVPLVFVVKKNVPVLKKLYSSLMKINTTSANKYIDAPMLMIDDEADNASINTNKPENDPTKINDLIRMILRLFKKNTYVGFTATPFANVFICYDSQDEMLKDDLFPRDFIYALKSPSNYCGAKKYFFGGAKDNVNLIEDADESIFPYKHKKTWTGDKLFNSVYEAINCFFIDNAIRDLRDKFKNTNRSMLINMSRFKNVHSVIKDIVEKYVDDAKRCIKQSSKMGALALTNKTVKSIYNTFKTQYKHITEYTWNDIFGVLYESIKDIEVIVVNSSKKSTKLNYEDHRNGLRVIAVGGLALSRGLTLEGLCVSYFYRNTATFDVLMQMGRWFGYRDGYDDLVKIYLTRNSLSYYQEISNSMDGLKQDIDNMRRDRRKPEDYGIRVRNNSNELGITAANKMRNTKTKTDHKTYYGDFFETPYIYRDLKKVDENIDVTKEFIEQIPPSCLDNSVKYPYFRNIPTQKVIDLISKLQIHPANSNFDIKQILRFLNNPRVQKEMPNFDLYIIGGDSGKKNRYFECKPNIKVPLVKRKFDITYNNTIIRMNAQRAHLWGTRDTSAGLSINERKKIESKVSGVKIQDYLTENRNPILIVYFVNPDNDLDQDEYFTGVTSGYEYLRFDTDLTSSKYPFIVGYGIGFPCKEGKHGEADNYVVNTTCDYYEKCHEEDEEQYGDEDDD